MSTIRRARIKASASHLASLAGKRRGGDIQKKKDDEISTKVPDKLEEINEKAPSLNDPVAVSTLTRECEEKTPTVATASLEKPRLKARFRPNLSESDQQRGRLRRISGCESSSLGSFSPASIGSNTPGRVRTISGGSSEPETISSVSRVSNYDDQIEATIRSPPSPGSALCQSSESGSATIFEAMSPPPPLPTSLPLIPNRTRKLTETSIASLAEKLALTTNPTVFDQRKADHKKKFNGGIPERTKLTMFDLIYYSPSDGNRMSTSNSLRSSRAPSIDGRGRESEDAIVPNRLDAVAERLQEEAVDDPDVNKGTSEGQDEEEEDEGAMPVPQVKVAADGSIILDEASTMIETTATKKAKEDLLKSPLVFESANQATNYGSWGKKKKNADWSDRDTIKFYKALSVFGTDFSLMEGVFKKRSRHELKMKFKKEEKVNRLLVDKCLSQGQTFDPSIFDSDEEDSEDDREQKRKEKENRRKKKQDQDTKADKRRKHRLKGRMYYNDSDDADESELASEPESSNIAENILLQTLNANAEHTMPAVRPATRTLPISRQKRYSNVLTESPQTAQDSPVVVAKKSKPEPESLLKSLLSQGASPKSSFAIPPALLAANPGLANATPGSLVVVASPASPQVSSPNAQLLEVFMVAEDEQTNDNEEGHSLPKRTRTTSESLDTTSIGRVRTHSGTFN